MLTIAGMKRPVEEEPVYWFYRLDRAWSRGDEDAAEQARLELRRLGVRVDHERPSSALEPRWLGAE